MSTSVPPEGRLSGPERARAPRHLDATERSTLARVADSLIPETIFSPAPSTEPDFWDKIDVALDARADAFASITSLLGALAAVPAAGMLDNLEVLENDDPTLFGQISTVVAGAWLLTAATRERIGYHGPESNKAGLEEAADDISSGILDPVLERYDHDSPRWIR